MIKHTKRYPMRSSHHFHSHESHRHAAGHRGHYAFGRGGRGEAEDSRGGRRRRVFDAGELRLVLLKLIADPPRHIYVLIRTTSHQPGVLYVLRPDIISPTLSLTQDQLPL